MQTVITCVAAALAEIGGCFAVWAWLRLHRSPLWLAPGLLCLVAFAVLLTRVDTTQAGRAYAAYGGLYIATALVWMWVVEGVRPDRWDLLGVGLSVAGALVILAAPHRQ